MRITARILFVLAFLLLFCSSKTLAFAQTIQQSTANTQPPPINNFLMPNVDPNVPQNHHEFTQIVMIDVLSALMCQLTGIDPADPKQPCLDVNPYTGKIGIPQINAHQTFGQAQTKPQIGGALGLMGNYIADLYTPAVSSTQYVDY